MRLLQSSKKFRVRPTELSVWKSAAPEATAEGSASYFESFSALATAAFWWCLLRCLGKRACKICICLLTVTRHRHLIAYPDRLNNPGLRGQQVLAFSSRRLKASELRLLQTVRSQSDHWKDRHLHSLEQCECCVQRTW